MAVLLAATLAGWWPHKEIRRSLPFVPDGRVHLRTAGGSVDVSGWNRPEVRVEAQVVAASIAGNQRACVDGTRVAIDAWPGAVRIASDFAGVDTSNPWWFAALTGACTQRPAVHYRIWMPRRADLTVTHARSRVRIRGIDGAVNVRTR